MQYCKVVIVGDSCVGKTQFVNMFVKRTFLSEMELRWLAWGAKVHSKKLIVNEKVVELQMWDLPGVFSFWPMYGLYFRDADGCIFLYNITNKYDCDQFHHLDVCIEKIKKFSREDVKVILVGNQCDLEEKREFSKKDGEKIAANYNLKFFETSAKTGHNVDLVFTTLIKDILSKRTDHVDHVESQLEVDERKQVNLRFFSKFKNVFSRRKPTNSVDSSNSRSSKENSSANGREIFTEQLLGDDRESSHQFAGTESVVKEFEPPDLQVLMPGPQVKTLDWSSCSQGTIQEVFNEPERAKLDHILSSSQGAGLLSQRYSLEVNNIDEPEQADGKNSQPKAATNDREEDDGLKEDCAYIEPESRDVIEPESRDVVEHESSLFLRTNDRNPTEDVDNTDYKCLLNIPNIITDES